MEKKPIKVGLWGIGRAGHNMHCSELDQFNDLFTIVAACDIDPDRVRILQEKYHCAGYTDGKQFLENPDVELVSIAVRSTEHVDYALKALKAGKIVFLEKPFALTPKGMEKLEEALKRYPGKLYFRHNRRFEAAFNHIRDIIDSGILGEVFEIKLRRHNYQSREDWQTLLDCGGGQINNWGPHLIDHSLRLLESPLESLWSDLKHVSSKGDADDHIKIIFRGKNGRVIDLEISNCILLPSDVYSVYGTRGTLVSHDESTLHMKYLDPAMELPKTHSSPGTPRWDSGYGDADTWPWIEKTIPVHPANGYKMTEIYKYLYAAIREGVPFPVKPEEAFAVIKTTAEIKTQNPQFRIQEDLFEGNEE